MTICEHNAGSETVPSQDYSASFPVLLDHWTKLLIISVPPVSYIDNTLTIANTFYIGPQ